MNKNVIGISAGAVGGVVGAWLMRQLMAVWHRNWGASPRDGAFGLDEEADIRSVEMLAMKLCNKPVSRVEAQRVAAALHYAYGVGAGAFYGWAANRIPAVRTGFGTAYGAALWLVGDELAISASGVSNPKQKSAASHLAALSAHLAFGAVAEFMRRVAAGIQK